MELLNIFFKGFVCLRTPISRNVLKKASSVGLIFQANAFALLYH